MSIYARHDLLPMIAEARAQAQGRAWFLVQNARTGQLRVTDDPAGGRREITLQVFTPRVFKPD